jgi:chorismate mutase
MSAFRFHIIRMHSLPLNTDKKKKEWAVIQAIPNNNNFPQHTIEKLNRQIRKRNKHSKKNEDARKFGPHSHTIAHK